MKLTRQVKPATAVSRFKLLESGCRIEELQLEKRERLEPALAFYMIIAWRVLSHPARARVSREALR